MVLLVVTSADLLKLTCTVIHRNNSLCLLVCVLDTFLFLWKWLHVFSCAFLSASLLLLIVFLIHIHMVSATHMSDFIAAIVLGPWRHKSISSCMQQQQLRHQRQTKATRAHRHGGDTDRLWKTQRKKIQRCARFSTLINHRQGLVNPIMKLLASYLATKQNYSSQCCHRANVH